MPKFEAAILEELASRAQTLAQNAYAPYSGVGCGCVVLLSDGTWVPGVRVENASYPLLIPAAMNAVTTAVAAGRMDMITAVSSRPFGGADQDFLSAFLPDATFDGNVATSSQRLVPPAKRLDPLVDAAGNADSLIEMARSAAKNAHVPESNFPVGCILETADGGYVPGCNVEHADWNLTLCAERNAISTAVTYGLLSWTRMSVTCVKDPTGSPCGACRQVLVEHAPDLELVMDRGSTDVELWLAADLLPNYFGGHSLRKSR
jgi:homotetrameric cytidine deaminase